MSQEELFRCFEAVILAVQADDAQAAFSMLMRIGDAAANLIDLGDIKSARETLEIFCILAETVDEVQNNEL